MAVSTEHSVRVQKPGSGASLRVDVAPGQELELGFFTDEVLFEISGPDLQLNFDDGARIILAGFFPAMEEGDCTVALPDGTEVSGQMISASLTTSWEDFHTNASAKGADASEPDPEAGGALPFFVSDEPSGLLCHDSCGLFDESVHLPGSPDPLFTPRALTPPQPDQGPAQPDASHSDGARPCCMARSDFYGNGQVLRLEDLLDGDPAPPPLWTRMDEAASLCRALAGPRLPDSWQPELAQAGQQDFSENADSDWQLAFLRLGIFSL